MAEHIPSLQSLSKIAMSAFGGAQSLLTPYAPETAASCSRPQLSCHNTSAVENLCCFNYPGGALLQTQFWDTHPVTGPADSWTIHGLWPDNCDGTYDANCDDDRTYTNITAILESFHRHDLVDYMREYWVSDSGSSEVFWEHEWNKHGTCISTLQRSCYADYQPTQEVADFFNRSVSLFRSLPTYDFLAAAGITPSNTRTYRRDEIQTALTQAHDGHEVYLGCRSGRLQEVWYFHNVKGSLQHGAFEASDVVGVHSTCPSRGIRYLPKAPATRPTHTATTTAARPTATGAPFTGPGYLHVLTSGRRMGAVISAGTWYKSGTPATFTATNHGSNFTLASRKGNCAIYHGALVCGPTIHSPTAFGADGSGLLYDGQDTFYADGVPHGFKQVKIYTDRDHDVSLSIEWEAR
ncbi:putative RNase T2 family protein [Teratosphaeria destructans]|uniref:Ribonuclease T2-like n=1 Tax=Teratosphaeria destructans TaxID=418781 RepID=A0A9W7STT9_9PEZI|nr:putative RNase T2 family protein [Teratosphaeria destructans]